MNEEIKFRQSLLSLSTIKASPQTNNYTLGLRADGKAKSRLALLSTSLFHKQRGEITSFRVTP